jgi:AbrB family looped-hinge helix DNA binding protein
MSATRIGRRGQIVLPKEVRQKIGVKEGDQIAFIIDGDQVVIKPITKSLLDIRGSVKVNGEQNFEKIRRDVLTKRAEKASGNEK